MPLRSVLRVPARIAARIAIPFLLPRSSQSPLGAFGAEIRRRRKQSQTPRYDRQRYPAGQPKVQPTDTLRVLRFLRGHEAELARTSELLADEESRQLLRRLLIYRALGPGHIHLPWDESDPAEQHTAAVAAITDPTKRQPFDTQLFRVDGLELEAWPANITADFFERQYFFKRHGVWIRPEPGDVVIDAGGCFGDTALAFAEAVGSSGHVHVFEPMPRQKAVIDRNLQRNPHVASRISVHEFALSDRDNLLLRFQDGGAGARADSAGDVVVTTRTIDNFVRDHGLVPTLVKMDIEGAEQAAIRGSVECLRQHRPKLAISAYHSLDDLVGLAPLIHSIEPSYRFYLDHHTNFAEETVLYAVAG